MNTPIHVRAHKLANDAGVSPVIGTILMVAVTVALGATVLAITSGVGDDDVQESANAVFQVNAVDSSGDGKTDAVKVTYVSGPSLIDSADVSIQIANTDGEMQPAASCAVGDWSAGDFCLYDLYDGDGDPVASDGAWLVTVSALGSTVVDKTVTLDE